MTDPEQIDREGPPTKWELLHDFVTRRFGTLLAAGLVGAGIFVLAGWDISIPRRLKLITVIGVLLTPAGYMVGNYIVGILYDPEYIYLLDLDASRIEGALFRFPYEHFAELEVTDGQLDEVTPRLYIGKAVSLEEMTAQGTWRGTLSDRELLRALTKIEECRGTLEDDAKRGFAIETQAFIIVRNAVRQATLQIVRTFEAGTLPDEGEGIAAEVDSALERYDLESKIADIEETDPDTEMSDVDGDRPDDLDGDRLEDLDGDPSNQEAPADD